MEREIYPSKWYENLKSCGSVFDEMEKNTLYLGLLKYTMGLTRRELETFLLANPDKGDYYYISAENKIRYYYHFSFSVGDEDEISILEHNNAVFRDFFEDMLYKHCSESTSEEIANQIEAGEEWFAVQIMTGSSHWINDRMMRGVHKDQTVDFSYGPKGEIVGMIDYSDLPKNRRPWLRRLIPPVSLN